MKIGQSTFLFGILGTLLLNHCQPTSQDKDQQGMNSIELSNYPIDTIRSVVTWIAIIEDRKLDGTFMIDSGKIQGNPDSMARGKVYINLKKMKIRSISNTNDQYKELYSRLSSPSLFNGDSVTQTQLVINSLEPILYDSLDSLSSHVSSYHILASIVLNQQLIELDFPVTIHEKENGRLIIFGISTLNKHSLSLKAAEDGFDELQLGFHLETHPAIQSAN